MNHQAVLCTRVLFYVAVFFSYDRTFIYYHISNKCILQDGCIEGLKQSSILEVCLCLVFRFYVCSCHIVIKSYESVVLRNTYDL